MIDSDLPRGFRNWYTRPRSAIRAETFPARFAVAKDNAYGSSTCAWIASCVHMPLYKQVHAFRAELAELLLFAPKGDI